MTDIVLFDIITGVSAPWSSNTWKVRLALNYKKLTYRTQWVHTIDIEKTCKPLGIAPTGVKKDGTPHYTLPALIDRTSPDYPIILSDSGPIIEYLEKAYPPLPGYELFPGGTESLQILFASFTIKSISSIINDLASSRLHDTKHPIDRTDYRRRMEIRFGKPFDTIEKKGVEREESYKELAEVFASLRSAFAANKEGSFLTGQRLVYADFALAAVFIAMKTVSPDDMWAKVNSGDGGRWPENYLGFFQEWMAVDNHPSLQ